MHDFVETKKRSGKTIAANLSVDEFKVIQAVTKWRVEQGYSKDQADCLRQMMHFIINKEYLQRYDFQTPSTVELETLLNTESND